jgi:hypothetical protein
MSIQRTSSWLCCWLWLGSLLMACGAAVDNGTSLAVGMASSGGVQPTGGSFGMVTGGASSQPLDDVSGGATNVPANTEMGGTVSPTSATGTSATSLLKSTGGQPGCNYQGQWHGVNSLWYQYYQFVLDASGTGIGPCSECTCQSDGFAECSAGLSPCPNHLY